MRHFCYDKTRQISDISRHSLPNSVSLKTGNDLVTELRRILSFGCRGLSSNRYKTSPSMLKFTGLFELFTNFQFVKLKIQGLNQKYYVVKFQHYTYNQIRQAMIYKRKRA